VPWSHTARGRLHCQPYTGLIDLPRVAANFVAWFSACLMRHKELSVPDGAPIYQNLIVHTRTPLAQLPVLAMALGSRISTMIIPQMRSALAPTRAPDHQSLSRPQVSMISRSDLFAFMITSNTARVGSKPDCRS
jgi:hypothetical protein